MNSISNYEVYDGLNDEVKKYITVSLSFMDYIRNNHFKINLKSDTDELFEHNIEEKEDVLVLSFFLGALYMNSEVKSIFNANKITFEKLSKFMKDGKNFNIYDEASMSEVFDEIDLKALLDEIKSRFEYNTGIKTGDFKLNDIGCPEIFDYLINTYYEMIDDLLESEINSKESLFETEVYDEYQDYINIRFREIAAKYGIDLQYENKDEETKTYNLGTFDMIYDFGDVFLTLPHGEVKVDVPVIGDKEHVSIWDSTKVYKINNRVVSKTVLDEFIDEIGNATYVNFTIWDPEKGENITFTTYKEDMFGKLDKDEIKNIKVTTPSLNKYGTDLTNKKFIKNPAIGRDKELDEIETVLLYPEKDMSIVIVGDAGVGKTALVEGLCYRIQNKNVPESLKDIKVIKIDVSSLVAGARYVGTLEERMESILKEASENKNIVLFIDEIHRAMGAGKSDGDDNSVAEILKQYLDRGDVRVIGTTTTSEYDEYVEPNTAFKTRLEKVEIKEPNDEVIYQILDDLITSYNNISNSKVTLSKSKRKQLLKSLIIATRRNLRDYKDRANNPRLIVNIIKRAYAIAAFEESKEVTLEHILKSYSLCDRLYESSRIHEAKIIRSNLEKPIKKEEHHVLQFKRK